MKYLLFLFITVSIYSQDLRGLWVEVNQENGEYSEFNLLTNENNVYKGISFDKNEASYLNEAGYCRFEFEATFNPETLTFIGGDTGLINKSKGHSNTVVRLRYLKDGEYEYLLGIERIVQEDGLLSPPIDVKYRRKMIQEIEEPISEEEKQQVYNYKTERANNKKATINVFVQEITLRVNDYGQEDNDSISIIYNDELIAYKIPINKKTKEFTLKIDKEKAFNQLYFIAHNVGDIPPNTTLVELEIDGKKFDYTLFTDLQNNALIDLKYLGKKEE